MRQRNRLLFLVSSAACSLVAQQAPTPFPAGESWPAVALDVRVQNTGAQAAPVLHADQLTVRDNGREVSSATLTASADEAQSVCLLLDTSGSTYAERNTILSEVTTLLQQIPLKDETCLIDFAASAYVDAPLTMDRSKVVKALEYFRPSGRSALRDALAGSAKYVERNGKFRSRVIVLISDGGENESTGTQADVERAFAERAGPALFVLLNSEDGTSASREKIRDLMRLAEGTGGTVFKPTGAVDRNADAETLVREMKSRYRLVYTAPDAAANGLEHKVEVQLKMGLTQEKMGVSVARRYYAPGQ